MDGPLGFLLFILLAVFVIMSISWHYSRSVSILEEWARANGYSILERDHRNFMRGPFFWTSSKGQTIYYVRVRDCHGKERTGYVRCGSFWFGLMSDTAEVRWDD